MKKNKYKIDIPEGYEVVNEIRGDNVPTDRISTTVVFKPVEKELPNTWEEYILMSNFHLPAWLSSSSFVPDRYQALGKLEILRDCYNEGWVPDWTGGSGNYVIWICRGSIQKATLSEESKPLAFKTPTIRDKFFENFRDLIEIAKPLL